MSAVNSIFLHETSILMMKRELGCRDAGAVGKRHGIADNTKFAACTVKVGRSAIIIIPGITGSELFAGEAITLWDLPASNPVEVVLAWYKFKSSIMKKQEVVCILI